MVLVSKTIIGVERYNALIAGKQLSQTKLYTHCIEKFFCDQAHLVSIYVPILLIHTLEYCGLFSKHMKMTLYFVCLKLLFTKKKIVTEEKIVQLVNVIHPYLFNMN